MKTRIERENLVSDFLLGGGINFTVGVLLALLIFGGDFSE